MDIGQVQLKHFIGRSASHDVAPAAWTCLFYFLGAQVTSVLAAAPVAMPNLRPGAAILLAALLANPRRTWSGILLAVLPVHLLVYLNHGLSTSVTLTWYVANCCQALVAAAGAAWLLREPLRLDVLRHAIVFVTWCAFVAPAVASLFEVGLLRAAGAGGPFWESWIARLVSSAAVTLVLVPVRAFRPLLSRLRESTPVRQMEAALLVVALLVLGCALLLRDTVAPALVPLVAYLPLPLLLWTAVRFGPFGAGCAFLLFAVLVVVDTAFDYGPFASDARTGGAIFLPLFLAGVAAPMLLLSAAIQERRGTLAALQAEQAKLGLALAAERKRAERLGRERHARAEVEQLVAERTVELRRANVVMRAEIAARRKALEAEAAAAARFSKLFRLSPDAMMIGASPGGVLSDVNDRWQQLFGYSRQEAIGRSPEQLNLYDNPGEAQRMARLLAGQGTARDVELRMRKRDGGLLQALVSGATIGSGDDTCIISIVRDVTDERRAEAEVRRQREQLTHLGRAVMLGELSGALAHELNQPLAAILSNAQAARRSLARPEADLGEIREILDDIVQEDKRAGEVIRRLRALFRKGELVARPLDVSAVVREALAIAGSNLAERGVSLHLQLEDGLAVQGDRVQLQQVLLNLVVNACDAMRATAPARRALNVSTKALEGARVQIAVADAGPGIPAELIGKIFDPFFTTKAEGLGFGLSISRAIISQHGGQIEAANNEAGGCAFRISLPRYLGETHG